MLTKCFPKGAYPVKKEINEVKCYVLYMVYSEGTEPVKYGSYPIGSTYPCATDAMIHDARGYDLNVIHSAEFVAYIESSGM